MSKIVAVELEGTTLSKVQLDTGRIVSVQDLIGEILEGTTSVEGVRVGQTRSGSFSLRTLGDDDKTNNLKSLPRISTDLNNGRQIPSDSLNIVAVRRQGSDACAFKLNNGEVITQPQAVDMVKSGELKGYTTGTSVYGEEYIRSIQDDSTDNNLSSMPEF